jgi:hypothetical protein
MIRLAADAKLLTPNLKQIGGGERLTCGMGRFFGEKCDSADEGLSSDYAG